ncbi:hypothetical protein EVJ58_g5949 [Rhodofomes roseus]|uniref:Uncharacterized protein n=1 Tax=Rhodofomes roseus TaxID=34475 RepID=A0A4Y9YE51_9APHY|nr:hypothetical protein EVJ58_g5949 [Rhodofomes roseus]
MSKPHIIHEDAFFASLPLSDYPALPSNVGNRGRTSIFPRMALTSSDSSMILGETDFPSTLPLEPPLPLEILMQILEYTASLSRPSAASVSIVSAWARKLALPHLFRALVHRKVPLANVTVLSATRSASLPASRTPLPTHLGQYVRALWTESIGMASPTSEMDIFRACPAVEHLALPAPRAPHALHGLPDVRQARSGAWPSWAGQREHAAVPLRAAGGDAPESHAAVRVALPRRAAHPGRPAYVPHAHLSNLTHLALPYLDLGANISHDLLRLPEGVLEHPKLKMVVLTVDERKYLHNPWYHIVRYSAAGTGNVRYSSPRESFRELVKQAHLKDKRVHVILSPRIGQSAVDEWDAGARGGESIWEIAERVLGDEQYGMELPSTYAPGIRRSELATCAARGLLFGRHQYHGLLWLACLYEEPAVVAEIIVPPDGLVAHEPIVQVPRV